MSEFGVHDGFDPESDEEGPNLPALLRDPVGVLKRGWWWIAVGFVLLAVPLLAASQLFPLQYESSSRLMMTSKAIPDSFVPTTIVGGVSEQFEAIQNHVFSRERLGRVIESSKLFEEELQENSMNALVSILRNSIEIEKRVVRDENQRERSLDIRISLKGEDPEKIASIVNLITTGIVDESIAYRNQQSQVTSTFMQREFERADQDLREHQRKLAQFRDENRGSLPEEQEATIAKLERLESLRRSLILQINDLRRQISEARSNPTSIGGEVTPLGELKAQLQRLKTLYTNEHPEVMAVENRIAALEAAESDERGDAAGPTGSRVSADGTSRLAAEMEAKKQRLNEIDAEVSEIEQLVNKTSQITEEYKALERKEVILQEAYTQYLRKVKDAELARSMELAQQGAQLVRLDSALPATSPVIPRIAFTAAALVLASLLSVALAFLHELVYPVIIDAGHLGKVSGLPVLGSIPPVA